MKTLVKPSVLVCVTGQYDCDRLIEKGYEQAAEMGWDLRVLCVRRPMTDLSDMSDEIEHLYRVAKKLGADMTVAFDHNAPRCAADFARKVNARRLVTGVPDCRPNGFVLLLHEMLPGTRITIVTKDNESVVYPAPNTQTAFA